MPGMGSGPFGHGPFGHFDWARQVLWLDIPEYPDRLLDKTTGGGALEGWQTAVGKVFAKLFRAAQNSKYLRDPEVARTRFQDVVSVTIPVDPIDPTISQSEVSDGGRSVRVTVTDTDPADPMVPLGDVSVGWLLTDLAGLEFLVDEVHKELNIVVVVGTSFPAAGAAEIRPPTMLNHLANDFGVDLDENDAEHFQRSSVRDAWQWYGRKGSSDGYEIIGDIFGHEVSAARLWYLGATIPATIPATALYEYPAGSGLYYTTYAPTRPLFDELAADVIPLDYFCWEEPLWTSDFIQPPVGPIADGISVSDAIGYTMQGLPIVSAVVIPGTSLYTVRVTGDLAPVAVAGLSAPRWYATFPTGDSGDFWLESTPVDIGGGDWTFVVHSEIAISTWGATANINYWCDSQPDCSFSAASGLLIDITPTDVLTETGEIWEQMIPRIVEKVGRAIPIHVKVLLFRFFARPAVAAFMVPGVHMVVTP